MRHPALRSRIAAAACALTAVAAVLVGTPAVAQERPADLADLPPVPTDYAPPKTAWGDPDISHIYQVEYLNNARILFQRPVEYGNRFWQTDEEHARRLAAAERSDSNFAAASERGIGTSGTEGLAEWVRTSPFALTRRRSFRSHPASLRRRSASLRLLRTASGVSPTGFLYASVKTLAGTLSRTDSRMLSSCPSGKPEDRMSSP